MKRLILILSLFLPILLIGVTREVSLDGTHQYTSIQSAINACNNGDIVQVYPGEYFEHLNTEGRNITIQSLYPITQSEATIDSTIIHSVPQYSCLKVGTAESVTINGFTMMNNYPSNLGVCLYGSSSNYGGGIYITNNSSIQILNCVIKNCISNGAGGVYFNGINFFMSNTKIFENYGIESAGGIMIFGASAISIVFDSQNLNSIFNNYNCDISLAYWNQPLQISLGLFSVFLNNPDYCFLSEFECSDISISVQNAYFNLINHDLYVAPDGDNANDGLTPETPLQTIAYAVKIIEPDSLNPKTIHLAPGTYNFSDSNQYFPFKVKSHTRLIGDNINNTVFDSELTRRGYLGFRKQKDICVENILFTPFVAQLPSLGFDFSENIVLRNLVFEGTLGAERILLANNNNVICENIIVSNASINNDNLAFRIIDCNNIYMNNILINDLDILGEMANGIGFSIFESDVTIRNSIIANCDGYDVSVLFYQNIEEAQSAYTIDLSNLLIYNNHSTGSNLWSFAPVYLSNRYQRMKMNNCTIANNNGVNTNVVRIKGDCDISNSILCNPGNYRDVVFNNVYNIYDEYNNYITYTHHPTISYSLFNRPYGISDSTLVTTNNLMIGVDPLFFGSIYDTLNITQPEYYRLSSASPCINAGSPDTLGLNMSPMDLAGNYRVWDNRIDMGCYEYGSEHYVANDNPEYPTLPDRISLSTYPNPVYLNSAKGAYCFIEFTLPEKAKEQPEIDIYNLKGQRVRTIKDNYELRIKNYELESVLTDKSVCSTKKGGRLTDKSVCSTKNGGRLTDKSVCSTNNGGRLTDKSVCSTKTSASSYSTVFDCRDDHSQRLASGIYIVKVTSGKHQKAMKMTILK